MERSFYRWLGVVLLSALVTYGGCMPADKSDSVETSDSREQESCSSDCSHLCGRNAEIEEGPGFQTNRGEFPWSVAIIKRIVDEEKERSTFICGGTLVARDKVLTTAECISKVEAKYLSVYIGAWDLPVVDESSVKVLGVENRTIHPKYNVNTKRHNLAVLILDDNVEFNQTVNRVCLAKPMGEYQSNHRCYTVGWGNSIIEGKNQLLKMEASLQSHTECQTLLRKQRLIPEAVCTLAAGTINDTYPCTRKIGSALVCSKGLRTNPYYLVGVATELRRDCSQSKDIPDVFMDVGNYTSWINTIINPEN